MAESCRSRPHGPFPHGKMDSVIFKDENEKQKFTCVYCNLLLTPPVVQTECGHRLCYVCAEVVRTCERSICPSGEDDCVDLKLSLTHIDHAFKRDLCNLPVTCRNVSKGCKDEFKMKDIEHHEANCPYNLLACPNAKYGCKTKLHKNELQTHSDVCTLIICSSCKKILLQALSKEHRATCQGTASCEAGAQETSSSQITQDHNGWSQPARSNVQQILSALLAKVITLLFHLTAVLTGAGLPRPDEVKEFDDKVAMVQREYQDVCPQLNHHTEAISTLQQNIDTKLKEIFLKRESLSLESNTNHTSGSPNSDSASYRGSSEQTKHFEREQEVKTGTLDIEHYNREKTSYNGVLEWKIRKYEQRKHEAKQGKTLYSIPFYTSKFGYKLHAEANLNGEGLGAQWHFSLFVSVMIGLNDSDLTWPFPHKITMSIMNPRTKTPSQSRELFPHRTSSSFCKPGETQNAKAGFPLFYLQEQVEQLVVGDEMHIKIVVDKKYSSPEHFGERICYKSDEERIQYSCVACMKTLSDAQKTKCDHYICKKCLLEVQQSSGKGICPVGKPSCVDLRDGENSHSDLEMNEQIADLPSHCKWFDNGCEAIMGVKDAKTHQANCEYRPTACPNREYGCIEVVPIIKLEEHERTCRRVRCGTCGLRLLTDQMEYHREACY